MAAARTLYKVILITIELCQTYPKKKKMEPEQQGPAEVGACAGISHADARSADSWFDTRSLWATESQEVSFL